MKQKLSLLVALFLCFTLSTFSASAKGPSTVEPRKVSNFNFLRAHRQGSNISLNWSAAVEGVESFRIERSYDGEFFEPVATVAAAAGTNRFLDDEVFPGLITYRVVAISAGGSSSYSATVSVRLVRRG
jgi:hypothetical protein